MMPRLAVNALLVAAVAALFAADEQEQSRVRTQFLEAATSVARAEEASRLRAEALRDIALEYARIGQRDTAEALLKEARTAAEDSTWAQIFLPQVCQAACNIGLVQFAHETAMLIEAELPRAKALVAIASSQAARGETQQASDTLREALRATLRIDHDYQRASTLESLAEACEGLQKADAVESLLAEAISAAKSIDKLYRNGALQNLANSAWRCGRYDLAADACAAIDDGALRATTLINLMDSQSERADGIQKMLDAARKAISETPKTERAQLFARAGLAAARANLTDRAKGLLAEAARFLPAATDSVRADQARVTLIEAYLRLDMTDAAVALLPAIEFEPSQLRARAALTRHFIQAGQFDRAVALATEIPGPFNASALLVSVAEECSAARQYDKARQLVSSIKTEPHHFNAVSAVAQKAAANGKIDFAVEMADSLKDAEQREIALNAAVSKYLEAAQEEDTGRRAATAEQIAERMAPQNRAGVFVKLVRLYRNIGQDADMARVVKKLNALPDLRSLPGNKAELAQMMHEIGNDRAAREFFEQAIASARQIGCAGCRTQTLSRIREQMVQCGYVDMVIDDIRSLPPGPDKVRSLSSIAVKEAQAGRRDSARQLLDEAMEILHSLSGTRNIVGLLTAMGEAYEQSGFAWTDNEERILASLTQSVTETSLPQQPGEGHGAIYLVYFELPGCPTCKAVAQMLDDMKQNMPGLTVRHMDILTTEGAELNKSLCIKMKIPERNHSTAPAVFSSDQGLVGDEINPTTLRRLAEKARGREAPWEIDAASRMRGHEGIKMYADTLTPFVVLMAGLADGFNPCVFAVIIFFITYMAYVGKNRREIALAGTIYTAAVFLTYLTIGVTAGLFLRRQMPTLDSARTVIYLIMGGLLLAAAALSVADAIHCMRGRTDKVTLKLPEGFKNKIRLLVTKQTRQGLTAAGALGLGVVVTLIELPCTGQVYVPIIWYLSQKPMAGFVWLLLYNICFILPLVVIFLLILFGATSQQIAAAFQRHMAKTKLALAFVFFLLAVVLLAEALLPAYSLSTLIAAVTRSSL
jgi:cytochrome c biogenesis protein CcdA/tetratricopeptide (TPR) repeat protein